MQDVLISRRKALPGASAVSAPCLRSAALPDADTDIIAALKMNAVMKTGRNFPNFTIIFYSLILRLAHVSTTILSGSAISKNTRSRVNNFQMAARQRGLRNLEGVFHITLGLLAQPAEQGIQYGADDDIRFTEQFTESSLGNDDKSCFADSVCGGHAW